MYVVKSNTIVKKNLVVKSKILDVTSKLLMGKTSKLFYPFKQKSQESLNYKIIRLLEQLVLINGSTQINLNGPK